MKRSAQLTCTSVLAALQIFSAATAAADRAPASFAGGAKTLAAVDRLALPEQDNAALRRQADLETSGRLGIPERFAVVLPTDASAADRGTWETLADGSRLWRLRVASAGAVSLNLHFERFGLPAGARMWLYGRAGDQIHGPWGAADANARGGLWTPIVLGDEAVIEVHVAAAGGEPDLRLASVQHAFRGLTGKQGSCNNDVICPEGDAWRDQIRAAARVTLGGAVLCSGQLVNNTAQDDRPLFLLAFHCITDFLGGTPDFGLIDGTVTYFNFESPVCGQLAGGSTADVVVGASLVAGEQDSDFLLLELDQPPPAEYAAFFAGWDISGTAPGGAVGIHHPRGDEKAISFENDPLSTDTEFFPNGTHWTVHGWDDGTTEGGSSGSCIFDPTSGLCVGILTGGFAACSGQLRPEDYYGKLAAAWQAGDTAAEQLRPHLDPLALGVTRFDGKDPGSVQPPLGDCTPSSTTFCLADGRFAVEVDWRRFDGTTGVGRRVTGSDDSGLFYFFAPNNWEMLVKVIDACNSASNRFWVFASASTNVEYTLRVTDTVAGVETSYFNPLGRAAPAITDTSAFETCP